MTESKKTGIPYLLTSETIGGVSRRVGWRNYRNSNLARDQSAEVLKLIEKKITEAERREKILAGDFIFGTNKK